MKNKNSKSCVIDVRNAHKTFKVPEKGQKGIMSWFYRKEKTVHVIKDISFSVNEGEFIGYIGPNGAGKSTTIKMLTGILHPTSGTVRVLGCDPHADRYRYTYNIGVVFGQRSLLEYDIPVIDSLILYKAIYEMDEKRFEERLKLFTKLLHLEELLHIPVRKLSLGQRMRCEIAASLLHGPRVIFLDEPTIGLDALAKQEIRSFLKEINRKEKVTIILTTHDMDDIEELCSRVVFINDGSIIYDGDLDVLKRKYITHKDVAVTFAGDVVVPAKFSSLVKSVQDRKVVFSVPSEKTASLLPQLLSLGVAKDVLVHEPTLEDVVTVIYKSQ